ncbi:MAG: peptidyl-prolyl cis-trans isomerase [Alphaproteobacteria bacterium]
MAADRTVTPSGRGRLRVGAGARARAVLLAVSAVACAALGSPHPAGAVTVNRIVVTVDGQPITEHQLEAYLRAAGRTDPAQVGDVERRRALDSLINDMIVQAETENLGMAPSADEIDNYIDQIKKRNNLDDEQLDKALEQQGMTRERYRQQVGREIQRSALLARKVKATVTVTNEDVQKYFDEHPEEFATAESVRVQHLLFPFREGMSVGEAEQLLAEARKSQERLAAGEKFDAVSRDAAAGPGHAIGGDLGVMKRGQMVQVLDDAAFGLKAGETSQPVRGEGGVHVIRVTERISAKPADVEQVREQIREKLYSKALEDRYNRWVESDLRKSHEIVVK